MIPPPKPDGWINKTIIFFIGIVAIIIAIVKIRLINIGY